MDEKTIVFSHNPVLLNEVIDSLNIKPDGIYLDGTVGGAGHSTAIAEHLTTGRLIALDRDTDALAVSRDRLARFGDRVTVVRSNFLNMASVCRELKIDRLDGVLMDLGVSSYQLDTPERGFSYMSDAPLDMRMESDSSFDAFKVVNSYSRDELEKIFYEYGEEKFSSRIAAAICEARRLSAINTTGELTEIIKSAIPEGALRTMKHHPAMRVFQAIRIEVNGELSVIEPAVKVAVSLLKPGGRLSVITFHSLEDRAVKQAYAELAKGCTCPPDFPVCVCGRKPIIKQINKKPIVSSPEELKDNPRAHSAKLRTAEKL